MRFREQSERSNAFHSNKKVENGDHTSGGSKNFEKTGGGGRQYLSAPSSFIANAHNELYAFYTEKSRIFEQILSRPTAPLNSPLDYTDDAL